MMASSRRLGGKVVPGRQSHSCAGKASVKVPCEQALATHLPDQGRRNRRVNMPSSVGTLASFCSQTIGALARPLADPCQGFGSPAFQQARLSQAFGQSAILSAESQVPVV